MWCGDLQLTRMLVLQIRDRLGLSDAVQDNSEIYVMQALSGG